MKILILSDAFPPYGGGGAETVAYQLAKEYNRQNHEVVVITTINKKESAGSFFEQNFTIYRLFTNLPLRLRAYWGIINWQLIGKVKKIIKKENPDIVHAHNVHSGLSYYSFKIIKKLGIPIILTVHDAMPFCYRKFVCYIDPNNLDIRPKVDYRKKSFNCLACQRFRYFPLRNLLIRHFFKKYVDKVMAVSQAHYQLLKANKIPVSDFIYNGLPLEEFSQEIPKAELDLFSEKFDLQNKKIILLIGRQHSAKGGLYFLKALKGVIKEIPNVKILILSKKEGYVNFLLKFAKKKGLADKVIATGWLEKGDLTAVYQLADLVACPSVCFETFGLVNLEAMAFKKPVIGTCFGGVPEIVEDNLTGYIVNPLNIQNLSEKILKILRNEKLAQEMGERGHLRLKEKFLIDYQVKHYLELMEGLIKSGAKPLN